MANDDILTDDYVASLLAKDAKESSIKYSSLGLEAFSSHAKPPANKPKPNTRFLRNIIKDTDSHNAALLAKEAAESRARLQSLGSNAHREEKSSRVGGGDIRRRQLGDIAAILGGRPAKRKRSEDSRREGKEGRRVDASSGDEEVETDVKDERRRKHRSRNEDAGERRSRDHKKTSKEEKDNSKSREHHNHRSRHKTHTADHDAHGHKRLRRSPSKDHEERKRKRHHRSRSPAEHKSKNPRHSSNPHQRNRSGSPQPKRSHHPRKDQTPDPDPQPVSDSDPLDSIIGPRPPPTVCSRGRGTTSHASGIDTRFSASYDPSTDVQLDDQDDNEGYAGNDWDQALEALRDRQKWKLQGAERLRAAGFSEEEVRKWERSGEGRREEDVRWGRRGEGREWDRGKVVGVDGVVGIEVGWGELEGGRGGGDGDEGVESSWGRLKGT